MGIQIKKVKRKTKYVKISCDCCGAPYPYTSYSSTSKATEAAANRGWDTTRYYPGDIYCPECIQEHKIQKISKTYLAEYAKSNPLDFVGPLNGTEPPKKIKRAKKSTRAPKQEATESTYVKYINSAEWREKSRIWRMEEGKCELCGSTDRLQCHHKHYRTLGKEKRSDIQVVCYNCHCKRHGVDEFKKF